MEKSSTAEPMASVSQGSFGTTKSRFVLLHAGSRGLAKIVHVNFPPTQLSTKALCAVS